MDVATQVAVPEFDGRIITVPFSFKEIDDDGLISYRQVGRRLQLTGERVRQLEVEALAKLRRALKLTPDGLMPRETKPKPTKTAKAKKTTKKTTTDISQLALFTSDVA